MKKIIGVLSPFDMVQTFYVYEDGNKLEIAKVKVSDIPKTVCDLARTYDTYTVELTGSERYGKGIAEKIIQESLTKYNENKFTFTYL